MDFQNGKATQSRTKGLVLLGVVANGGNESMLMPDGLAGELSFTEVVPFTNKTSHAPSANCNDYDSFTTTHLDDSQIKYQYYQGCLAVTANEHCEVRYSPPICRAISLTMLVKTIAMFLAARVNRSRTAPPFTLGDAVASFTARPDLTTTLEAC